MQLLGRRFDFDVLLEKFWFCCRIPMILVGNKIDRTADRVVSTEEGRNAAKTWNVPFVEVSAMDLDVRFSFLETRQHKQRIFFLFFKVVKKMFERTIHAMENIDSPEIPNDDHHSVKSHSNENSSNSRNGMSKKLNGNSTSKDSSGKSCTVS